MSPNASRPSQPRNLAFGPFAALALAAAAALLPASHAAAAPQPSTYEFVDLGGRSIVAQGLVFTPDGVRVALPDGARHVPGAEVDWYETFYRNIRSGATNVIVFRTGSLLRFDRLELKNGTVTLTVAGGGQISLAESLVDFEGSVREGAMVRLPEGAGPSVQVSKSSDGAWAPEDTAAEETPASRRRASAASRRRAAASAPGPMVPADGSTEAMSEEEQSWSAPEEQPPEKVDDPRAGRDVTRPLFPRRGQSGRPDETPTGEETEQATGQAVVTISTDYSGVVGGLQVQLQYPPNIQVVEPVQLTGFASNWLATPNSTVPGQIAVGGAAPPGTSISGGEFLRVTFMWSGQPPARQLFRIAQMVAVGENSESLGDFRTTMDVQISP